VQLKHDEREEGQGWVEISAVLRDGYDGDDDTNASGVLVRSEDVQHNRNYYDKDEILNKMAADAMEKVKVLHSNSNATNEGTSTGKGTSSDLSSDDSPIGVISSTSSSSTTTAALSSE